MKNKLSKSKLFFMLALLCLAIYFFASLPYGFGNNTNAISGNWCDKNLYQTNNENSSGVPELPDDNGWLLISSPEQLGYWAYCINNNFGPSNWNVKLTNNINLLAHYWTPVKEFSGTFDGQGFSIQHMWIQYDHSVTFINSATSSEEKTLLYNTSGSGFISQLTGIIKDVNFVNPRYESKCDPGRYISFVAGYVDKGTIENCNVIFNEKSNSVNPILFTKRNNKLGESNWFWFGGIAGHIGNATKITGCSVESTPNSSNKVVQFNLSNYFNEIKQNLIWGAVGGIVGETKDNSEISLCRTNINILGINKIDQVWVGGIVGGINDSTKVEKCCNYGNITVGINQSSTTIQNANIGGIVGFANSSGEISNCFNMGEMRGFVSQVTETIELAEKYDKNMGVISSFNEGYYLDDFAFICATSDEMFCSSCYNRYKSKSTIRYLYDSQINSDKFYSELSYTLKSNYTTEVGSCYKGGIAGYVYNESLNIINCYNGGIIDSNGSLKTLTYKLYYNVVDSIDTYMHSCRYGNSFLKNIKSHLITYEFSIYFDYPLWGQVIGGSQGEFDYSNLYALSKYKYIHNFNFQYKYAGINGVPGTSVLYKNPFQNIQYKQYSINGSEKLYCCIDIETKKESVFEGISFTDVLDFVPVKNNTVEFYVSSFNKNNLNKNESIWAQDTTKKINNGNPYIKEMYWKHSASDKAPASISFEYNNYNKTNKTVRLTKANLNGNIDTVEVPSTITENGITYKVTEIGSGAFAIKDTSGKFIENKNSPLKQVILPNTIETIGSNAFYGCSNLEKINMPTALKTISSQSFDLCKKLQNVNLPNGLETIGSLAFASCHTFTEIRIPNSVKTIGDRAFGWTSSLTKITAPFIGNSRTATGEKALLGYWFGDSANETYLTEVQQRYSQEDNTIKLKRYIPTTLTTIKITEGEEIKPFTFYACTMLKRITYPSSVTKIGAYAFYLCQGLSEVDFSNIETIGKWAFSYCDSFEEITLTSKLYEVGEGAFAYCGKLIKANLTECKIKNISTQMFCNDAKLGRLSLPDSLENIGQGAFENCTSIPTLTLYSNLKSIQQDAFKGCSKLTSIKFMGTITLWNKISKNANIPSGVKIKCIS